MALSHAVCAQDVVERGKGDSQAPTAARLPGGVHLPDFALSAIPAISSAVLREMHVEPAADVNMAPDLLSELQYNLERIELDPVQDYSADVFLDQAADVRWDVAGAFAITTAVGLSAWGWEISDFRFQSEGWFGKDTKYLGMDKLGHAYTGYILSDYFTQRIAHEAADRDGAAMTGALLGLGVQTYVEVLDGFSGGHGFSYEDLVMDGVGAGFSYLRSTIPGLAETVDFRMEYLPSGFGNGFAPVTDYSGQKYLLALKLSGFEEFQETPLRFVELQVGYYARGISDEERARGDSLRREPYVAVGFNL
ncbi:MAG: DUF2279 domain-containing protein, partial [Alphaproteobacteria bacterium]|nr:DUF2279 domain-containing protein [Alphaproteobacteria bacterium]